jgi:signal transduction histidine kinase
VKCHLEAQYRAKEIQLYSFIGGNVTKKTFGDRFRLEHVLGNLLSNAIKFSEIGCSKIDITVTMVQVGIQEYVRFGVRDYGIGFSSEEKSQLFHAFRQIRPGELQQGRGSGLDHVA